MPINLFQNMAETNYKPTGVLALYQDLEDIKLASIKDSKISPDNWWKDHNAEVSEYHQNDEEKKVAAMIRRHFTLGDVTMQKPRVEFNDTSVLQRAQLDEMSWNVYQPNNGEPDPGDVLGSWKSNAIRPVVRNKCISIAAHATARLIFPKVFAQDKHANIHGSAAKVMEDLMEWSGQQSNYSYFALNRTIAALIYPASIGYTEYTEVYRRVKMPKEDGTWEEVTVCDEDLSGFQDSHVPVDQLYIENFYEPNIQKQGWLIWRRVRSYSLLDTIYQQYENWKYVAPGVQLIYNDANQTFYQVYDANMRPEMCEEIIYWNRNQDLKIVMVNGVMLTKPDNPNPRLDKLYPFDSFGYELINNRCFYYKSLAFKLQSDANIVNTLYPMIIDGTYLQIMPAMVNVGGEAITSDVIVPGAVTTLSAPDADLRAINTSSTQGLQSGMNTLFTVEKSLDSSSVDPSQEGQQTKGNNTAYEISRIEQNASTVLGLFIQMISNHVRQYGRLRLGDILQYLTIADVDKITGDSELVYKTFILPNQTQGGKSINKKIQFDSTLPSEMTKDEELQYSLKTLSMQGGVDSKTELARVNPQLFRELKYKVMVSPDILNPRSEDLERAFKLEIYDRAIANPITDQEAVLRDFLFGAYPAYADPDKYIAVTPPAAFGAQPNQMPGIPGQQSPLAALSKQKLPNSMPNLKV